MIVKQHDVMDLLATADLVKLDIEGGEWAILADPRFAQAPPRAVVLEYHCFFCPGSEPREEAHRLLAAAGMRAHSIWDAPQDGAGMVWALRK